MYALEAHAALRSPAYWQGIDIARPFDSEMTEPHWEYVPVKTMRYAGAMLLGALRDVVRGEYAETKIPPDSTGSTPTTQYPDGTVVVLDREQLVRYEYADEHRPWEQFPSRGEPIEEPFVPYWLQNQAPKLSSEVGFGSEGTVFPDHHMYTRWLSWGVLLSSEKEAGRRLLPTWPIDNPRFTSEGLYVGVPRDASLCLARDIPLGARNARLQPPFELLPFTRRIGITRRQHTIGSHFTLYLADRIRSARIIYTANGPLPVVPDIDKLADGRLKLSLT